MNSGILVVVLLSSVGQMKEEFYQDFRGDSAMDPALGPFGPNSAEAMHSEAEGLRVSLSAGRGNGLPVGFVPRFKIAGDFEITVGYEILSSDEPYSGMGAGVKVWGKTSSKEFRAMTLAHVIRPQEGCGFVAIFARDGDEGRVFETKSLTTDAKTGRLRLARTGSELSFLVAEGESETFDELQRATIGPDDVVALRITANTGDVACAVTIRFLDLRIRAEDLPERQGGSTGFWGRYVVGFVLLQVAGVSGFLLWRHQRRRKEGGERQTERGQAEGDDRFSGL